MNRELLTVRDASLYLGIGQQKLKEMARNGEIPSFRLGKRLKFVKSVLDRWLMLKSFNLDYDINFLSGGAVKKDTF